ncbi:hypothetical protein C8F01DRAFT_1341668 [Mycena amicta]|nr:hypothetical protein C8F01DRAFT_1341668 [Mycena amicta]
MKSQVPSHAEVLVIGGGPGGAYTASVLAKEGIDVVVLEAAKFPRYHIGESMLPSIRHFLRFIGAEDKVENPWIQTKGAAILFNHWKQEGYTEFGEGNHSWNVERAELDEILLRHAEECGAKVYEEHRVTEITFAEDADHRPVSALYTTDTCKAKSITFNWLVDASGRTGILSTKYLKNRHMNETLKNIACWAYWTGAGMYAPGTRRHNAPWFEALTDESGWAWFIPLKDKDLAKKTAGSAVANGTGSPALKDHYLQQLDFVPRLKQLLEGAELLVDPSGVDPTVRSASDFSYTAMAYYGDHFRLVGDAGAFIDPFFSSGVHLAISGGLTAAVTIAASIRGHCSEEEAGKFHDTKVAISYTRFLLTVMGAYRQMRNQRVPVLSDIDESEPAFNVPSRRLRYLVRQFRPRFRSYKARYSSKAPQTAGKILTEDELQKAMDFVTHIFVPTDPEMQQAVNTRLGMNLLAPTAPIFTDEQIANLANGDEDTEWVMHQANATKAISDFYSGPERLLGEVINGYAGCTKAGSLGLVRVGQPE